MVRRLVVIIAIIPAMILDVFVVVPWQYIVNGKLYGDILVDKLIKWASK